MLQLKNIIKNYTEADHVVRALRDVSLAFRKSEFVSVLGPSGCGKTTMLNIIGGLDQYTSGDLVINGVSTKHYKDRDWDAYRNHSVGFVFQNYHLIPHQSVLANVELALSLSGVGKRERRQRAKEALERVGLGDQLRKKPGQMSGGQMQRVAIARALVNNPDIILADEPTGALDTETSVQVMEILKEISRDRLVIMVTHNPELAEKYSSRIIRMLDGQITDDSAPLTNKELAEFEKQKAEGKKEKKRLPSMPLHTSFGLSLKNLFTKKGRTFLTAFAGSIGIIGIALIFAVSQGMTTYINAVQEETLTAYPLTIEATMVDLSSLMGTFMGMSDSGELTHERDKVYSQTALADMVNALNNIDSTENDLKSFKAYLEEELKKDGPLKEAVSGVQYTYGLNLQVYTENVDGRIIISDTEKMLQDVLKEHMNMDMSAMLSMRDNMLSSMSSGSMNAMSLWCEMLSGRNGEIISPLVKNQYDKIYGEWPTAYNEVVLVVNENNELEDITLYALGLKSKAEIDEQFHMMEQGQQIDTTKQSWSYEDICGMEFKAVRHSDCYSKDAQTGLYTDLRLTDTGLHMLYRDGLVLKVTGILRPNPDVSANMLPGAIGYTYKLTEYLLSEAESSDAVQAQMSDPQTDILTGLPFRDQAADRTAEEKAADLKAHINGLDAAGKAQAYIKIMSTPTQEQLEGAVQQTLGAMTRTDMEQMLGQMMAQQTGMDDQQIAEYIASMADEEIREFLAQAVREQVHATMETQVKAQLAGFTDLQLAGMLDMAMTGYTQEQCAAYYDVVLEFSESSYEENLKLLGVVDMDSPATINLYASSFENKEVIEDAIARYNASVEELKQIRYTDYVGLMMSSVTTIIDAITYVLISFVAISLVVSSIMIGVITLISVQERTKEIGILRAIGASKRNVSSMFTAETVIVGFAAGLLGVGITYLLCIPINAIIHGLTGINNLSAVLPAQVAAILVGISVLLTLLSGVIPSRSAAKKDPVVALRTE
jgi:putative ABC transport system permease protein